MSEGFKKGKIPERFEGKTDEQLAVMQHIMWNSGNTVVEEIEGKITTHLTHYFDDELAAVQIIKKIERLEKALDKACALLNCAITNEYCSINKESNLIEAHIEPFMTIKKWKEWCMKDEDR